MIRGNLSPEHIQNELKKRFLSPQGVLYDYAGENGEVERPTPEECRATFPNVFGWWTPIENGAFFTGDYLLGLLRNTREAATEERIQWCRTLLHGLFHLQDAAETEGCILRGVGADGKCHYPATSCDQVVPWLLALYEFQHHPLASEEERAECRLRLLRVLNALRERNWTIPGERPGCERGSFLSGNTPAEAAVSSVNLLLATALLSGLSGEEADRILHIRSAVDPLPFGGSRLRILETGLSTHPLWMGWFLVHTVYAMRLLSEISPLPEVREAAEKGMEASARHFLPALPEWKRWRRGAAFSPDWRICRSRWIPHDNCAEGEKIALAELPLWNAESPRIKEEKNTIRFSLAAAWMVLLSGIPELKEKVHADLQGIFEELEPGRLSDVSFYLLENVISEW